MKNIFFILSIGVIFTFFFNPLKAQTLCDDETVLISPNDDIEGGFLIKRGGILSLTASNKVEESATVTYQSENYILFEDGFKADDISNYFLSEITDNLCITAVNDHDFLVKTVNNYPNPFSENTVIEFSLKQASNVQIQLFNTAGQFLQHIQTSTYLSEGAHQVTFNAGVLDAGIYLFRIIAGTEITTGRMTLIK